MPGEFLQLRQAQRETLCLDGAGFRLRLCFLLAAPYARTCLVFILQNVPSIWCKVSQSLGLPISDMGEYMNGWVFSLKIGIEVSAHIFILPFH